jgi:hypothetical protein
MAKSRIREWAERARRDGIEGQIINQVNADENFEENVVEGLELITAETIGHKPSLKLRLAEQPSEKLGSDNEGKDEKEKEEDRHILRCASAMTGTRTQEEEKEKKEPSKGKNGEIKECPDEQEEKKIRVVVEGEKIGGEEGIEEGGEGEGLGIKNNNLLEANDTMAHVQDAHDTINAQDARSTDAHATLREGSSSDFPELVGEMSNVKREILRGRKLAVSNWRKFVRIVPLNNIKTVTRQRMSDTDRYLPVPQGAEHEQGSFSSYKVTYVPHKYERGVDFTWEMFVNDDLGAFRNIGVELGRAAENTMADFVIGLVRDNGEIYDGKALFHADHGNIGTGALAEASLGAAITSMKHQISEKGNPLMVMPGFLLVPPELEFTARKLIKSTLVPGSNHNDVNVLKGMVEVVVEPLLSDANNWFLIAKPSSVATIEVGFLAGRQSPEIMVEEGFDRDVIRYKGRVVFGGAVMDYRGFYGGIV